LLCHRIQSKMQWQIDRNNNLHRGQAVSEISNLTVMSSKTTVWVKKVAPIADS
jgi:hypothetical protein